MNKIKCMKCGATLTLSSKDINGKHLVCPKCGSRKFLILDTIKIY